MSPRAFHVGDVVRMRSGGPPMTVTSLDAERNQVCCMWFESRGRPHYYFLKVGVLEPTVSDGESQFSE